MNLFIAALLIHGLQPPKHYHLDANLKIFSRFLVLHLRCGIILFYPRVAEIVDSSTERASRLAGESRPLHHVVPLRMKMFFVGDKLDYCNARFVNPDFSRISKHKTILKTRSVSVNLADLERLERGSRTILAGDSRCFWLLSSLLALLKDDGYRQSDPALFDRNISSLSAALASQTMMAAGGNRFCSF